jgi:hypothetical protein
MGILRRASDDDSMTVTEDDTSRSLSIFFFLVISFVTGSAALPRDKPSIVVDLSETEGDDGALLAEKILPDGAKDSRSRDYHVHRLQVSGQAMHRSSQV